MATEKRAWYLGIAAALFCPCCALPAMLSLVGATGALPGLEWLHTFRPLFMLIALGSVLYLWYKYYQHTQKQSCCSGDSHSPYHNKYFLMGLSVFILSMTLVPVFL